MNELLSHVNKIYGFNFNTFEKVKEGSLSENYILIGDTNKYFLKKYRFNNENKIKEIHSVKNYFAQDGIPVILPIRNKNNKTFFLFKKEYYALFPFIFNKELKEDYLTNKTIISLGEMLGRIHLLGKNSKLPIKEVFKEWDKQKSLKKIKVINSIIRKKQKTTNFDKLTLKSIETKKKLIKLNTILFKDLNLKSDHLIHGDYIYHNVFFNDDKVLKVFDFEKTNYSPRVYELLRAVFHSFFNKSIKKKDNISRAKLFIKAYCNIYPISKKEISQGLKLFYLKLIHGVWVEEEHYIRNNNRVDKFLQNNFDLLQYLSEHYNEFEKELLN
ncbi:MAG: phosphotransferase [Candidatus Paceibacterota bacterium]